MTVSSCAVVCSIPEKRSEITAMTYLASCDMIVCGHEDGSVVFWNPDAKR